MAGNHEEDERFSVGVCGPHRSDGGLALNFCVVQSNKLMPPLQLHRKRHFLFLYFFLGGGVTMSISSHWIASYHIALSDPMSFVLNRQPFIEKHVSFRCIITPLISICLYSHEKEVLILIKHNWRILGGENKEGWFLLSSQIEVDSLWKLITSFQSY